MKHEDWQKVYAPKGDALDIRVRNSLNGLKENRRPATGKAKWVIVLAAVLMLGAVAAYSAFSTIYIQSTDVGAQITEAIRVAVAQGIKVERTERTEDADVMLVTDSRLKALAGEGAIAPLELETGAPGVISVDGKAYGLATKVWQTWLHVDNKALWAACGIDLPENGVMDWDDLVDAATKVRAYREETGEDVALLAVMPNRFPNECALMDDPEIEAQWKGMQDVVAQKRRGQKALLSETVLSLELLGYQTYVTTLRREGQTVPLAEPEMRCYVLRAEAKRNVQAKRFVQIFAELMPEYGVESGFIDPELTFSELRWAWTGGGVYPSEENLALWKAGLPK